MNVLGFESSCDETGVAVVNTHKGLLAHALHSQVAMHEEYGGVVPELASRDHIRRVVPLTERVLAEAGLTLGDIDAIAYTAGPGLAGALLVGASVAQSIAWARSIPAIPIHHLEGHLLSPLLADPQPQFPFVALLVSGGHTQLMQVDGVGQYRLLGETLDDAAGEAFDKTAKLLGLDYPGGPALAAMAETGDAARFQLPRPKLHSDDLDFSFSGLKTAVLTRVRQLEAQSATDGSARKHEPSRIGHGGACLDHHGPNAASELTRHGSGQDAKVAPEHLELSRQTRADLAASAQAAIVDVLVAKSVKALKQTGLKRLVIAGGVGANQLLRARLKAQLTRLNAEAFFPPLSLCTDNGAMIAFAAAMRIEAGLVALGDQSAAFTVLPRWSLEDVAAVPRARGNAESAAFG